MIRRFFVAASAFSLASIVKAAGTRRGVTKYRTTPKLNCGIPQRDYISALKTGPALAMSQTAQLVPIADDATVTVVPTPRTLTRLAIGPDPIELEAGETQQTRATGTYSDGSTQDVTGEAMPLSVARDELPPDFEEEEEVFLSFAFPGAEDD